MFAAKHHIAGGSQREGVVMNERQHIIQPVALIPMDFHGNDVAYFIDKDGNPWWPIHGPCAVLGYQDELQVLDRLDLDEKQKYPLPSKKGTRRAWCINEPGIYNLVLGSNKPEAKAFKRWITHEVLPTIRRSGRYTLTPAELNAHFLGPAPLSWEKRFELEFFKAVCYVYRQRIPTGDKHSPMLASFIRRFIYNAMPRSVFEEMDRLNPIIDKKTGRRKLKLHQLLRLERIGDFLVKRIDTVMDMLRACRNLGKEWFKRLMAEHDMEHPLLITIAQAPHVSLTVELPWQESLFQGSPAVA
jgi:prophage antirepressor-like protein